MNIKDLPQGSYQEIQSPKLNINSLPSGSYQDTNLPLMSNKPNVQEQPTPFTNDTLAGKAINNITKVGQGASNFLFGSTGKTVGSLVGSGVESARNLFVPKEKQTTVFTNEQGTPKMLENKSGGATTADIAFTALELYPGGGAATKLFKSLPGGKVIAEGASKFLQAIPNNLKEKALKQYASIFRATSNESKGLVAKTTPRLLADKQIITSIDSLKGKAGEKVSEYGSQINDIASNIPISTKVHLTPIVNKLEQMKSAYTVAGKVVDESKIKIIDGVKDTINQFGKNIAAKDALKVRRILDESINDAGGFIADKATKYTAKIEKLASDSLRSELAKEIPDLAKVNGQYSFWSNVKNLANYTIKKNPAIMKRSLGAGVGATILGIEGGKNGGLWGAGGGIIGGAILGEEAIRFMKSPAWKSVSAITKNEIADNIAKGNKSWLLQTFKRLGIGIKNSNN